LFTTFPRCSWVSIFCNARRILWPLVSTIHGRQHVHLSSRIFSSITGNKFLPVCEAFETILLKKTGNSWRQGRPSFRNGIDLSAWMLRRAEKGKENRKIISVVGRLSGPKGDVVRKIVEEVFPKIAASSRCRARHLSGVMKETEDSSKDHSYGSKENGFLQKSIM